MELDFDKYCVVDRSPTTVLPVLHSHSKVASRKSSRKPKYKKDIPSLIEDFTEINFSHYRSASCRDVRSQRVSQECNEVLKRGSVYQSSNEARMLQKTDAVVGRKKIEFSRGTEAALSFGIIDSLCSSDEDSSLIEPNRPLEISLSEQCTSSVCNSLATSQSIAAPINEVNSPYVKDLPLNLHKPISVKLAMPHSSAKSDSDSSRASSPKARFNPVRKVFDPFVKSKSHRSPLSSSNEACCENVSELSVIGGNKTVCKSLMYDKYDEKENHISVPQCSPAHLHGYLKLGNKRGVPFLEFSVKSTEDVYVAKTWKVETGLTWVYTFHSLHHRRKSNTSGWGFKDINRESSMVGQMQVSCHLDSESRGAGESNDSMVTEFVVYDTIHSRKNTSSHDNNSSSASDDIMSWGNCESKETSAKTKARGQLNHSGELSASLSQPLTAAELHPELEIAAIVMEVPFEKRDSLEFKSGDNKRIGQRLPNLPDPCQMEGISDISSPRKMHVVVPAGNHSLPITESCGPSPLLDRWRLGGGCDCGGWDMSCPLKVFSNLNVEIGEVVPLMDDRNKAELFVQVISPLMIVFMFVW